MLQAKNMVGGMDCSRRLGRHSNHTLTTKGELEMTPYQVMTAPAVVEMVDNAQRRRPVLVYKIGRKFLHVVGHTPNNSKVHLFKVRPDQIIGPVLFKEQSYPVRRAVRRIREWGRNKHYGITKTAKQILARIG